jgi:hypothetical protein
VVVAVLLVVVGPDHDQQHCYHHGKAEADAAADDRLMMMGIRMPETC